MAGNFSHENTGDNNSKKLCEETMAKILEYGVKGHLHASIIWITRLSFYTASTNWLVNNELSKIMKAQLKGIDTTNTFP